MWWSFFSSNLAQVFDSQSVFVRLQIAIVRSYQGTVDGFYSKCQIKWHGLQSWSWNQESAHHGTLPNRWRGPESKPGREKRSEWQPSFFGNKTFCGSGVHDHWSISVHCSSAPTLPLHEALEPFISIAHSVMPQHLTYPNTVMLHFFHHKNKLQIPDTHTNTHTLSKRLE